MINVVKIKGRYNSKNDMVIRAADIAFSIIQLKKQHLNLTLEGGIKSGVLLLSVCLKMVAVNDQTRL